MAFLSDLKGFYGTGEKNSRRGGIRPIPPQRHRGLQKTINRAEATAKHAHGPGLQKKAARRDELFGRFRNRGSIYSILSQTIQAHVTRYGRQTGSTRLPFYMHRPFLPAR